LWEGLEGAADGEDGCEGDCWGGEVGMRGVGWLGEDLGPVIESGKV